MTRNLTNVGQFVEQEIAGETEVTGENLPQCHFVHNKSYTHFHFCDQCTQFSMLDFLFYSPYLSNSSCSSIITFVLWDHNSEQNNIVLYWRGKGTSYSEYVKGMSHHSTQVLSKRDMASVRLHNRQGFARTSVADRSAFAHIQYELNIMFNKIGV
jgi:hypothetical protein